MTIKVEITDSDLFIAILEYLVEVDKEHPHIGIKDAIIKIGDNHFTDFGL